METTLPRMLAEVSAAYPDNAAQAYRADEGTFAFVSYRDCVDIAWSFAAGLLSLGVRRGDLIGLIADNRREWFQADMGIMAIGAVDVPRGCDASEKEIGAILESVDCAFIIAENSAQTAKVLAVKERLKSLKGFITFDDADSPVSAAAAAAGIEVTPFADVCALGRRWRDNHPGALEAELAAGKGDDLACIIFTSGTTGEPKGVMLSHRNFLAQLDELNERIFLYPGERALLVLPVWHVFERLCEYVITSQGATLCYSKPIASVLLPDLQTLNPQLIPAVPRVFEAIYDGVNRTMRKTGGAVLWLYRFFLGIAKLHCAIDRTLFRKKPRFRADCLPLWWVLLVVPYLVLYPLRLLGDILVFKKIRAKLGTRFRAGISGGGALPPNLDAFFWAVGVNVVEGYGLTETAPVVSVRPISAPVFGTVGKPIRHVEVRVVGENGAPLPPGKRGEVQVRGDTVMKGYYRREDLTAKVIDGEGWFSTGDIGTLTVGGEIVLRGRKKDTIVLRGGENVEPLPIEMVLNDSRYISQSVVVGQDQRSLGALIVPAEEEVRTFAEEKGIAFSAWPQLLKNAEVQKLFEQEIHAAVNAKNGFRLFERIGPFCLLPRQFEVSRELSLKQEIARYRIAEIYKTEIRSMYK